MAAASTGNENLAFARQFYRWFADRDFESLEAALDPDVVARPSIRGGPTLQGREQVAKWWDSVTSSDDEVEVRPLDFEARGDCVIVRGYLREREGTTLAESQFFWLFEFRDGRIARMESHPTRAAALAHTG